MWKYHGLSCNPNHCAQGMEPSNNVPLMLKPFSSFKKCLKTQLFIKGSTGWGAEGDIQGSKKSCSYSKRKGNTTCVPIVKHQWRERQDIYKIANARQRSKQDKQSANAIEDKDGKVLIEEEAIRTRGTTSSILHHQFRAAWRTFIIFCTPVCVAFGSEK